MIIIIVNLILKMAKSQDARLLKCGNVPEELGSFGSLRYLTGTGFEQAAALP